MTSLIEKRTLEVLFSFNAHGLYQPTERTGETVSRGNRF